MGAHCCAHLFFCVEVVQDLSKLNVVRIKHIVRTMLNCDDVLILLRLIRNVRVYTCMVVKKEYSCVRYGVFLCWIDFF